jgi:hypothetical protein
MPYQVHVPPSNALLDAILRDHNLKNDAALSRYLDVFPAVISKIRHGRIAVGPAMMLTIHEKTGMPVKDIKFLLAQVQPQKLAA